MNLRALLAAAALAVATPSLASAADAIKIAVTDIEGLEALQSEFGPFEAALEKSTGLDIELFPVGNRTAAVEAHRSVHHFYLRRQRRDARVSE